MKKSHQIFAMPAFCALVALGISGAPALAQPDLQNAPKAENPENRGPGAQRPRMNQMTPEQREEMMQNRAKRQLEQMGVTDATVQQVVLNYIEAQTQAREDIDEKARALQQGLRGNALTDTQVAALLHDYNAALEENKARRATALAELNKSINLLQNPRLEAFLTLSGFIGDGPAVMGGRFGNFNTGRNNRMQQNNRGEMGNNFQPRNGAQGGNGMNNNRPRNRNNNQPANGGITF